MEQKRELEKAVRFSRSGLDNPFKNAPPGVKQIFRVLDECRGKMRNYESEDAYIDALLIELKRRALKLKTERGKK